MVKLHIYLSVCPMLYTIFFCRSYLTGLGRDDELLPPGAGEETKVITHIYYNTKPTWVESNL